MPNDEMGPLPQADHNAELQDSSIKALNALLRATSDLVLRDERIMDYGVDGSLEVKLNGGMTNIRSQLQLKGSDKVRANIDGAISLEVRTYNLNYLLNGLCPLYVLYDAAKDQLWFVWARDEQRRLCSANPDWFKQDNVTIRFSRRLGADILVEVRDRILAEGRLRRQIHDTLARSTILESVSFNVNAGSLEAITAEKAESVLATSGMTIVASGFPEQALRLFALLPAKSSKEPRFQMVAGYAHYMRGRFQMGLGAIAEAVARKELLSAEDQFLAARLRNACEYRLGMIDSPTYLARSGEIEQKASGSNAILIRIESLHERLRVERTLEERGRLHEEYARTVKEVLEATGVSACLKLQTKLSFLYMEGTQSIAAVVRELVLSQMRRKIGIDATASDIDQAHDRWRQWELAANKAYEEAAALGHPMLIADALAMRLSVQTLLLTDERLFSAFTKTAFHVSGSVSAALTADANNAIRFYQQAGILDGELQTRMALADFEEIRGNIQAAKEIATDVLPVASAMGYQHLVQRACELIHDSTGLMLSEAQIATNDTDVFASQWSDEEVKNSAKNILAVLGIPANRLPVIERDSFAMRQCSIERVHWCQHFELHQDLRHTASPETIYTLDPNRWCYCSKHGHRSMIENPDATAVIHAFKDTYCKACLTRAPKAKSD